MKGLTMIAAAAMLSASFAGAALAQGMASKDDQIKTATSALPAALRDGATVISYDSKGLPQVLRQGNNNIFCSNNSTADGFNVSCRGNALRAASDFAAKEKAEGKDAKAIGADTDAAYTAGKLTSLCARGLNSRSTPVAARPKPKPAPCGWSLCPM